MTSIKDFILARAAQMAEQDGVQPAIVHVVGAVNQIHLDLARARDELIAGGAVWVIPASARVAVPGDFWPVDKGEGDGATSERPGAADQPKDGQPEHAETNAEQAADAEQVTEVEVNQSDVEHAVQAEATPAAKANPARSARRRGQ